MSDTIIEVENISKQYRLGQVSTGTISHDLNRLWYRVRGKDDPYLKVTQANVRDKKNAETLNAENLKENNKTLRSGKGKNFSVSRSQDLSSDYVWALQDINFEVKRGEVLGIIGRNGAGKSTLLKILSRVTAPTTGEIRVDGRIASLLEVGTGFHPELTGRENIFLNGAILGMSKAEIHSKLDEIVDFSGCARYLNTPTKRYSSGMIVRLGFAVAAHLEPDILVVDEVLAVGDLEFQAKCLGKMSEVASHGRTVLFVSHNLASVESLCASAIWIDRGRVAMAKDDVSKVVAAYEKSGRSDSGEVDVLPKQHRVVSPFQIHRIEIVGLNGTYSSGFKYGEPVRFRLLFSCSETLDGVSVGIAIHSSGLLLTTLLSKPERVSATAALYTMECVIPGGALLPGMFHLDVGASRAGGGIGLDYIRDAISFSISDAGVDRTWKHDRHLGGVVRVPEEWSLPIECSLK